MQLKKSDAVTWQEIHRLEKIFELLDEILLHTAPHYSSHKHKNTVTQRAIGEIFVLLYDFFPEIDLEE